MILIWLILYWRTLGLLQSSAIKYTTGTKNLVYELFHICAYKFLGMGFWGQSANAHIIWVNILKFCSKGIMPLSFPNQQWMKACFHIAPFIKYIFKLLDICKYNNWETVFFLKFQIYLIVYEVEFFCVWKICFFIYYLVTNLRVCLWWCLWWRTRLPLQET